MCVCSKESLVFFHPPIQVFTDIYDGFFDAVCGETQTGLDAWWMAFALLAFLTFPWLILSYKVRINREGLGRRKGLDEVHLTPRPSTQLMRYFRRMDAEYIGYTYKDYENGTVRRRKATQIARDMEKRKTYKRRRKQTDHQLKTSGILVW